MIVKRVGPVSCAKITGLLYAIIGLIIGAFTSLFAMFGGFASGTRTGGGIGAVIGIGAIIAFPILYGCLGFLMTLFAAWLYNILAGVVGGVQVDLE